MSKLLYKTAISLLTSSAMAMTFLDDASDTLSTTSHTHVTRPFLNSYAIESMPELRIVYDEDSKKKPERLKRDKKKNAKSKEKARNKNRRSKYAFLFEPSEDSSDNLVTPARVIPETRKVEHDVASLLDFAVSNKSGRSSTYEWDEQINDKYITEAIEMLWQIKDRHGELPGVAQILLGDLWPIVKREDHDQNVIGLLDNNHPTFTEEDVELLLSGIDGDSPLDVISLKNIETYCTQDNPIVLYATLLRPYMKYRVLEHSKESEDDLAEIMNFIERRYQSLDSDERQEITAKLNIMAIFESGLAREYADTTVYEEFIQQLSDEIEDGEKSVQDATDALVRQLDYDNTLDGEVDQCVRMLAEEGYQYYVWEDDEDEVSGSDNATTSSLCAIKEDSDEETDYSDAEEVAL